MKTVLKYSILLNSKLLINYNKKSGTSVPLFLLLFDE